MSLDDQIKLDDEENAKQFKKDARRASDTLKFLKEYESLAKDHRFIRWFDENVTKPISVYRNAHEIENETNKNFILKGRVQAYKEQYGWLHALRNEMQGIEDRLNKSKRPDRKPEN